VILHMLQRNSCAGCMTHGRAILKVPWGICATGSIRSWKCRHLIHISEVRVNISCIICNWWVRSQNSRNQAWISKSGDHNKIISKRHAREVWPTSVSAKILKANWRHTLKWDSGVKQHILLPLCCWLHGICVMILLPWLTVVICD
jgi:hypothetical protein